MSLRTLLGLSEDEWEVLRDDEERRVGCCGAIDLDTVEYLMVDYKTSNQTSPQVVQDFMKAHPDFCIAVPYEGCYAFLFAEKPQVLQFDVLDTLHRGAVGIINDCPRHALILLDLD